MKWLTRGYHGEINIEIFIKEHNAAASSVNGEAVVDACVYVSIKFRFNLDLWRNDTSN